MQFYRFLPTALVLPTALLAACGDFDRYDDRVFDFPATAEPPVPHPIPYVPEPEPPPASEEVPVEVETAPSAPVAAKDAMSQRAPPAAPIPPTPPPEEKVGPWDEVRPPIEAPRKNVGLKRNKRGIRADRGQLQAFPKERALEEQHEARDLHRPNRLERAHLSGDRPRMPPRAMGSHPKERPIKRSALSSARDGD